MTHSIEQLREEISDLHAKFALAAEDDAGREELISLLLSNLEDCALIVNGMSAGTLPSCFKPTLEFVNQVNYAIAKAKGQVS